MPNRLINESSPYLLQHAHNPVDWYPWNDEALARAKQQDKPILLSIGYAACHWCHVMERESFENNEVADLMNELFVCIKVDREERPDLDKIYQTTHQMLTQRPGGWPLTVALTPQGHSPFFAGTYFPPEPLHGMPGFGDLLKKIFSHFQENKEAMDGHDQSFHRALNQLNPAAAGSHIPDSREVLNNASTNLSQQFDATHGGFGDAPKFPHPKQIELLLQHAQQGDTEAHQLSLAMATKTLRNMALGGLFDQLGGGFYRYSVDKAWCIPHFEKMLYDNAQLLSLYCDIFQITGEQIFQRVAHMTADWVIAEMQQPHGGYASTLDADSEGSEGKYYVWSETDLRALLSESEYSNLETAYGLIGEPNFEGNWHLNRVQNPEDPIDLEQLTNAQDKLLQVRQERIRPALDDKILTSWNGLMIGAMAKAGRVLSNDEYISSAKRALEYIKATHWQNRRLLVTSRDGKASLNAYLDDYAFLAQGIFELCQSSWNSSYLTLATEICDAMLEKFEDPELGGFFFTSNDHEKLLYRPKAGADDATPSGNGVAADILARLGHLLADGHYIDSSQRTLKMFADAMAKNPSIFGTLNLALQNFDLNTRTVVIRDHKKNQHAWQSTLDKNFWPEIQIVTIPADARDLPETLQNKSAESLPVAFICQGFSCDAPVFDLEELKQSLSVGRRIN